MWDRSFAVEGGWGRTLDTVWAGDGYQTPAPSIAKLLVRRARPRTFDREADRRRGDRSPSLAPRVTDHQSLYHELLPHLREPRGRPPGEIQSFCPAHPDGQKHKNRSLSLSQDHGLTCWAGCTFESVLTAFGLPLHGPEKQNGVLSFAKAVNVRRAAVDASPTDVYEYVTTDGRTRLAKGRWDTESGKTFRWRRQGAADWNGGLGGLRMADVALWGAQSVLEAASDVEVYVCEGEKAVLACRARGLLATTHGGGASTRDFGDSLAVLAGRRVAIWPDNDQPGRDYAAALAAALRPLAANVRLIAVQVPAKGDAHDYFAAGGTIEALEREEGPALQVLAADAVRVRVPTLMGEAEFTFRELEKAARALDAEMTIRMLVAGTLPDPYVERINLLSMSARESCRRELEAITGKGIGWAAALSSAMSKARDAYLGIDRSLAVADIASPERLEFIVDTLIPEDGVTIWFGAGSSTKTLLAYRVAVAVARGEPFLGRATKKRNVLVIDYETGAGICSYRMKRLVAGTDSDTLAGIHYWAAGGVPLLDQVAALRRCIDQHAIGFLILDHCAMACGGEPEKADSALRFFRGAEHLKLPMLAIAHVTGEGERDPTLVRRPFGTVYWSNGARRTWFLQRQQEQEADRVAVGFYCRKVNDGRLPSDFGINLIFEGDSGPIEVTAGDLRESPALNATRGREWEIHALLAEPMPYFEIGEALDMKPDTVRKIMSAHPTLFRKVDEPAGGRGNVARWERATAQTWKETRKPPEEEYLLEAADVPF